MRKTWTLREERYLRDNYKQIPNREIAEKLGRSRVSVKCKCDILNLRRTQKEKSYIISNGMKKFFNQTGRKWSRIKKEDIYNRRDRRNKLIIDLGGKCIICKIDDSDVLQFDHINNDGYLHQNKHIINQVETNPEKFQILCANCNTKKEVFRREFDRLEKLEIPPF